MRKKKNQVTKVAAETGLEVKDLDRLPQDALTKLDALVPDDSDLLGSDSEGVSVGLPTEEGTLPVTTECPSEELPVVTETTDTNVPEASSDLDAGVVKEKIFLGYHPVSGLEVWSE